MVAGGVPQAPFASSATSSTTSGTQPFVTLTKSGASSTNAPGKSLNFTWLSALASFTALMGTILWN
jgi:hypothetical protein